MNMEIKYNKDMILIISKNGKGKSSVAKNIIEALKLPKNDVIVLDTSNSFTDSNCLRLNPILHNLDFFDSFLKSVMKLNNKLIIIDDIDAYPIKQSQYLSELAISQRHLQLGMIIISRRIIGLPKVLIGNFRYIFFSGSIPSEDVEYLRKNNIDIDTKTILEETKEDYTFLVYDTVEQKYYKYKTHK